MIKKAVILLLGTLTLASCSDTRIEEIRDENGALLEKVERDKESGARQGIYQRYGPEEVILEEANYRNDTLHGERKIYFKDGTINIVEHYDRGNIKGEYLVYHPEGGIAVEGQYIDGSMEEKWNYYYPSGQLKEVVTFRDNEENGPFTEYYENGKLKARGQYRDGDFEHGIIELYDTTGTLTRKLDCDYGRCKTIWSLESQEDELED